ncbi:hypothetical protein KI387_035806 [Taxus chinensis]|uniref:Uncharacterized protein n=1 Tax=Taxus chinensis TaxID=29808 RepID=A0AA38L0R0_TAXCH|nr:hypothetical protein KI387_035806 [Taxus chinensis]
MGRSPCCEKAHTNKGAWTKEEDEKLVAHIRAHGEGCWRSLPKAAGLLRCGKSCRLRWVNYLRPDLRRGNFSEEEDELVIKMHALLGNKWSLIAGRLPGRTDNEIKNYWNTHIKRKLQSRGTDPQSRRPIQPIHNNSRNGTGDSRSPKHEILMADFFGCDRSEVTTSFEQAASDQNSSVRLSEREDINLDLSISLPLQNNTERTLDSQEVCLSSNDEMELQMKCWERRYGEKNGSLRGSHEFH